MQNQRIYKKNYQITYIARYIWLIKCKASFFYHIVDYKAVNKLKPSDFLLALVEFPYQTGATHYMLSQVLSQYFGKEIGKKRIIINGVQLSEYR